MTGRLTGVVLAAAVLSAAAEPVRVPVLVELFTSEGCSSCPPADRLLQQLDARAVVLSEHVDYWNRQAWKDPFSSAEFTARQQGYERLRGVDGVYTPQMVVDGAAEFNGSDARRAVAEIGRAARRRKASVRLTAGPAGIQVDIDDAPEAANVFLAFADPAAVSHVARGENAGRLLQHVAVARGIRKIGSVRRGGGFHQMVKPAMEERARRAVVFLQGGGQGTVSGAAVLQP